MLGGFALALVTCFFLEIPLGWLLALVPGILDGVVQLHTAYESNNLRRLWTGILMGWGSMSLLIWSFVWTARLGRMAGLWLRAEFL